MTGDFEANGSAAKFTISPSTRAVMQASIADANLDRGGFHLSMPYTIIGWILWGIGIALAVIGIVVNLLISALGFLLMAFASPGSLEAELKKLRDNAQPAEVLAAKAAESGIEVQSYWRGIRTITPSNDPNDWILPAPGPATWNDASPYDQDEGGEPLPEHPHKVGTPRPATLSGFGIWSLISGIFAIAGMYMLVTAPDSVDETSNPSIIIGIGAGLMLILGLVGFFKNRMNKQMLDTPTSLVRSVAVGYPELVGQVRPVGEGSMSVEVGHASHRRIDRVVAYRWTHEVYRCRTETDSEGNTTEKCNWDKVEDISGELPFVMHDGTGGLKVETESFKRRDWGQHIKRWESNHDNNIGRELFGQIATKLMQRGRIKKHRWTIWALRLGDPVYILGNTKSRTDAEIDGEGLDRTKQHHLLKVVGEDAPGVRAEIRRGTELSNIGRMRSGIEMVAIPFAIMLGIIGLFGVI